MALQHVRDAHGQGIIYGKSTDTKPADPTVLNPGFNAPTPVFFVETDTGKVFIFDPASRTYSEIGGAS